MIFIIHDIKRNAPSIVLVFKNDYHEIVGSFDRALSIWFLFLFR
jgi:hypothetical protein